MTYETVNLVSASQGLKRRVQQTFRQKSMIGEAEMPASLLMVVSIDHDAVQPETCRFWRKKQLSYSFSWKKNSFLLSVSELLLVLLSAHSDRMNRTEPNYCSCVLWEAKKGTLGNEGQVKLLLRKVSTKNYVLKLHS